MPERYETPSVKSDAPEEPEKFICQYCGKELKSKAGLTSHEKSCKHNTEVGE